MFLFSSQDQQKKKRKRISKTTFASSSTLKQIQSHTSFDISNESSVIKDDIASYIMSVKAFSINKLHTFALYFKDKYHLGRSKSKKEQLFYNGKSRLKNELEIEKVLKQLKKIDLLESIVLTQHQNYFVPYLATNILVDKEPLAPPPRNSSLD